MTQRVCVFTKLAASCGNIYLADSNPQISPTHLSVWLDSKHLQTKCIHHVFTTLQVEFVAEPAANKATFSMFRNYTIIQIIKTSWRKTPLVLNVEDTNTTQKTCNRRIDHWIQRSVRMLLAHLQDCNYVELQALKLLKHIGSAAPSFTKWGTCLCARPRIGILRRGEAPR